VNQALRQALADSRLTDVDVATRLGVDPKTVRRWIAGKRPYPRHRWAVADLLGIAEDDLWPENENGEATVPTAPSQPHVYPHRWVVPHDTWHRLFESANEEIGILVYSGLFLADDTGIVKLLESKAREGVNVRLLLGDPDSVHVRNRGIEEGIGDAMAAKIRNALVLYRRLLDVDGVELRLHDTVLYASIYRADDRLLVNPHVYGAPAANNPVFAITAATNADLAETYLHSFDRTWQTGSIYAPSI
jgi:transcriptional regulator with XRE-family HTH domain